MIMVFTQFVIRDRHPGRLALLSDIISIMIIDSHVHLITSQMIETITARLDKIRPGLLDRVNQMGKKLINPDFIKFLKTTSIKKLASMWEVEMKKNRIDHACFLPIGGAAHDQMAELVGCNRSKFSSYIFMDNPSAKASVAKLRRLVKSEGFVGIKLYPCLQMISIADKKLFPLYEAAGELDIPILIHFGITHAPIVDYRYTNPLDLQLPSKTFPGTNFIIAHFGAGFFREILLLGFHSENIYIDTSGTNNWREYLPKVMPLSKIFKRTIEVYGASRLLYGTDTALNDKTGYRTFVLKEQTKALKQLKIPARDQRQIMGGNAAKLFRIEDRLGR